MFIRKTQYQKAGKNYHTFRLVQSERIGKRVRQRTLLNLGAHFPLPRDEWKHLCLRLEQLLKHPRGPRFLDFPPHIETEAQRIAAQLVQRAPFAEASESDFQHLDVNSLQLLRPRSVGVEHVGLWALRQLGLEKLWQSLGWNRVQRIAAMASLIGRMAAPASELATWHWLRQRSGLGELLHFDFEQMTLSRLYRASDLLMKHRASIEQHLFEQVTDLFALQPTVTLYDLTNTYLEGSGKKMDRAEHGHSKEKRSDCRLLTLALVLDGSGLVRRSQVFAGNVSEAKTLTPMFKALAAPQEALVVMDAGIAKQYHINWLRDQGYRYLVVSAERKRTLDATLAETITTRSKQAVELYREVTAADDEVRLYCYSPAKAAKEKSMNDRLAQKFEQGLQKLQDGLAPPRTRKSIDDLWQRMGRLRENSRGAAQHYEISIQENPADPTQAQAVHWHRAEQAGTRATHPGVYCLRTNVTDWDAETLWHTYTMLTDLEAVFRSFKSELGLRLIYHQTELRAEGHLFIPVLAYQLVQTIRQRLRAQGERSSWTSLRRILEGQQRVTASFRCPDGRAMQVRKATQAEPPQQLIYHALGLESNPGGVKKLKI